MYVYTGIYMDTSGCIQNVTMYKGVQIYTRFDILFMAVSNTKNKTSEWVKGGQGLRQNKSAQQ